MAKRIDIRRFELVEARADAAEDAFEEWESAQLRGEWWDYPADYPIISRRNLTPYAKQFRRSQQVVVGSRSTAHG